MMHRICMLLFLLSATLASAEEITLDTKTLLAKSISRNLQVHSQENAIVLDEGELIEDDGPAAGYSYLPNEERLGGSVWIKKELIIPNSKARQATLLVGPGGDLKAIINGQPIELRNPTKAGSYWQAYDIPPACLKAGKNEIILHGSGKVWIARADDFASGSIQRSKHPNRSARSADAGKTWDYERLGPTGNIDGEYNVRLHLVHHRPTGSLELPVFDAGNLGGKPITPLLHKPLPFRIHLDAIGSVTLRIRTGTTIVPDAKNWSAWRTLKSSEEVSQPTGRFFLIAVDLATDDPLQTPRLKSIRVEANPPKVDDWSKALRIVEMANPEIVRSAIPFEYEPFDHPLLKELRTRHKLDDVVKDAKSELETIERLARWSSQCWEKGHLKDSYPQWNALEILKPHADGKPIGGFCQQYNLVLLQACESFGIPGRAVSISVGDHGAKNLRGSGHEVVELWSNQFAKWIYVDGNMAWYAVDAKSRMPLSLWELRERQLATIADKPVSPVEIVHLREEGKRWTGLRDWPFFLEMRLIPRSNFLQAKTPLPLNQGMRGWFWSGHYAWTDPEYPASLLYGQRISSRRDWEWTLNQTHVTLEATATVGELRVHLDTVAPGFDSFVADIDAHGGKPVVSGFIWKLHAGKNRLEVRSRNVIGPKGNTSRIIIE